MMEKSIKIDLGGVLFQIDEDAYKILKKYLGEIDARLRFTQGGAETMEDIEARIAEIFRSLGGQAGVVSKENVEQVISTIGSPETFEAEGGMKGSDASSYSRPVRKKMYRNEDDKIIGGVCGGMGAYLDIEPVWMRVLFIIFTCFFGVGFLVYVGLWIALPVARSEAQKKEMYGDNYHSSLHNPSGNFTPSGSSAGSATGASASNVANAFNEVFRAIARVIFVIVRVFLIITGVTLVLGAFFILVAVIMVFFFKYPGYFSTDSFGINLFYFPNFLNYIVNPAAAPWIVALTFLVIGLPLFALIYWGVKMIFWFKARDGVVSLIMLLIWVGSIAALTLILFNEGISYSDTAKSLTSSILPHSTKNLYVVSGHSISALKFDKEISLPEESYDIYFTDDNKNLYIGTRLHLNRSDDKLTRIDIVRRSTGRSRIDATSKAESLIYNYTVSGDTVFLDDYFTVPTGSRWSVDNVTVNISVPEGTKVHFDNATERMYLKPHYENENWMERSEDVTGNDKASADNHTWIMTEEGLEMQRTEEKK